jgi:hypothetical protein
MGTLVDRNGLMLFDTCKPLVGCAGAQATHRTMVRIEHGGQSSVPSAGVAWPAITPLVLAAQQLVASGAIMTLLQPQREQHLIGYLEWLEPRRLFWFTAYGEDHSDAHLLEFDAEPVIQDSVIYFRSDGKIVSLLSPIERAEVEDPDDYTIAWRLWQEVMPLRRALIETCCTALVRAGAADCMDGQPRPRTGGSYPPFSGSRAPRF